MRWYKVIVKIINRISNAIESLLSYDDNNNNYRGSNYKEPFNYKVKNIK